MIIEQYGIRLKRLTFSDIELVRKWRNYPEIRKQMAFKKHITKEMQEKWFFSINNKYNYYYLIEYNGRDIGVINSKNINLKDMYGEGGIFIWDKKLDCEFASVLASLCFLNAVFFVLKIFNKSFIQVLPSNPKAIQFNRSLGYVIVPGQEKSKNPYYVLTREDYTNKTKLLRETASKLTGDFLMPRASGEVSDKNLDEINDFFMNTHK
ncbi:MAG: GNAT family N-acetyltransferase [Flavobacteriales bacterium]